MTHDSAHRAADASRLAEGSAANRDRVLRELESLDYRYDGLPVAQTFSNWARVGEKIRHCRNAIRRIHAWLKEDRTLLHADRQTVRERAQRIWEEIAVSEETTFFVHGERARQLYDEAHRAVDCDAPGQAHIILKANQAEFRTLWLSQQLRESLWSHFQALWVRLESRKEAGRMRRADWVARQEEAADRLSFVLARKNDSLRRVCENLEKNRERLEEASPGGYRDRIAGWIREDEEQQRQLENAITEIEEKVRKIRESLGGN